MDDKIETDHGLNNEACKEEWELTIERKYLLSTIKAHSCVKDELVLMFEEEYIQAKTVDPAHVMMLDAKIQRGYTFTGKTGFMFWIPGRMMELLALTDAEQLAFRFYKNGQDNNMISVNWTDDGHKMKYTHFMVDPAGYTEPKIPNLKHTVRISVNTQTINKMCKKIGTVSDYFTIRGVPEGVEYEVTAREDDEEFKFSYGLMQESTSVVKSMYNLSYFHSMIKAIARVEKVLKEKQPVYLSWSSSYPCTLAVLYDGFELEYMFAPRIESS